MSVRVRDGLALDAGAKFTGVIATHDYLEILRSVLGLGTISGAEIYYQQSPSDRKACMGARPVE